MEGLITRTDGVRLVAGFPEVQKKAEFMLLASIPERGASYSYYVAITLYSVLRRTVDSIKENSLFVLQTSRYVNTTNYTLYTLHFTLDIHPSPFTIHTSYLLICMYFTLASFTTVVGRP